MFLFIIVMSIFQMVHAETVSSDFESPRRDYPSRGGQELIPQLKKEVEYMRGFAAKSSGSNKLQYAYINKRNTKGGFDTYLVELSSGKMIDSFTSLIGYNGMGCGKGQTPPGVLKLTNTEGTGASRKKHWGNNWKYFDIQTIPGSKCPEDTEIVAHSNKNLAGKEVGARTSSKSAGCFTVPPEKLEQMDRYAGKAYIYNVQ